MSTKIDSVNAALRWCAEHDATLRFERTPELWRADKDEPVPGTANVHLYMTSDAGDFNRMISRVWFENDPDAVAKMVWACVKMFVEGQAEGGGMSPE